MGVNKPSAVPMLAMPPPDPGVYYTYTPLALAGQQFVHADGASGRSLRLADARLRRAVLHAWVDPAVARTDIAAAVAAYSSLQDVPGISRACAAHADLIRADGHLSRIQGRTGRSPAVCSLARVEYERSAELCAGQLQAHLDRKTGRKLPVTAAYRSQRRPAGPLTFGIYDAFVASIGGDECIPGAACWTSHHLRTTSTYA